MNRTVLFVFTLAIGCDKHSSSKAATDQPATGQPTSDPACTAKLGDFEPWFAHLAVETRSHELDFGYALQVIDREPMPVSHSIDAVEIRKTSIAVFDVSEHDHAHNPLGDHPTPKAIADRVAKIHDMKAGPDDYDPAPDDLLRIDVDSQAPWSSVVLATNAATQAGYSRVVFAFTATPKLVRPPGVGDTTESVKAAQDASDKLDRLQEQCKAYGRAVRHAPARDLSPADDAAKYAKAVAAALVECHCVPDPDEVRKLEWIDARWHQARPRVGVVMPLDPAATTTIALPAKMPWSDAHTKILAATGAVKLVAN